MKIFRRLFEHKSPLNPESNKEVVSKPYDLYPIGTFLKVYIDSPDFDDAKVYLNDKNHDLTLLDYAGFSWFVGKIVGYTNPSYYHIKIPSSAIDSGPAQDYILDIFPNVFTMNVYDSGFFEKLTQEEYEKQLEVIRPIAELRMREKLVSNDVRSEIVDLYFDSTMKLFEKLKSCINDPLESSIYISKLENRLPQMGEEFKKYRKPVDKLKGDFIELIVGAKP